MPNIKELPLVHAENVQIPKPFFILLLGPSGSGKSSLINILKQYVPVDYVTPVMDRPLRIGEKDKKSVSEEEFTKMESDGEFVVVNNLYGNRYGTPKSKIDDVLSNGRIPILDFPLDMIEKLSRYKDILYKIYIVPPTLGTLRQRLSNDKRMDSNNRFEEGKSELLRLIKSDFVHPNIDEVVVNRSLEQASSQLTALIRARLSFN